MIVAIINPTMAGVVFIGLLVLLRFCLLNSEVRNTKLAFEFGELLEVYRPHDVDHREFLRLGAICETGNGFLIEPPAPASMNRVLKKLMLLEDVPETGWVM